MKSAILYVQMTPGPEHSPVIVFGGGEERIIFIRAVIFDGDVADALDASTGWEGTHLSRTGEFVLNTIPLP